MATTIEVEDTITVGALADKLMIPVTHLIGELMKNGVMATVNEQIDFDTAQIIVEELGIDVSLHKQTKEDTSHLARPKRELSDKAEARPPVVAVMGHVDHGKTTLLDAIRGAQVAKGEAGGITQHISAYQVKHNGRLITFLDTPGHEAFSAIREHSARLTDIVVLVVAADDGIKPQTLEAIRFAHKAGVKIIVAINKMDKEGANADLVKSQLSEHQVVSDDKVWHGDTPMLGVSAKTGDKVPELLDMILLVADVDRLRAETTGPAGGLIIEAHVEQGRGSVAHGLVETGILRKGDFIVAGSTYAKIRNLETTDGKSTPEASPSTPVVITGFKELPEFGDEFTVVADEKTARALAMNNSNNKAQVGGSHGITSSELIRMMNRKKETTELNIIVKADVQGSLTSVIDSLKSLDTSEVAVRVVGSGIGAVTENDVHMAQTSKAAIYGFNITIQGNVKRLASRDKVKVQLYNVIYELISDVKEALGGLLTPEVVETDLGRLVVRAVFNTTKTEVICGGETTKGKLTVPAFVNIMRGEEKLAEAEVISLKRGPVDTKEVLEGEMCGVSLKTTSKVELLEGDRLEFFKREVVTRHL